MTGNADHLLSDAHCGIMFLNHSRTRRSLFHHWQSYLVAVGAGVQQLCASTESQGYHQQDHGVGVGLLRCHLSGQLHCQPGCLHDPRGIRGPGVWLERQKGNVSTQTFKAAFSTEEAALPSLLSFHKESVQVFSESHHSFRL